MVQILRNLINDIPKDFTDKISEIGMNVDALTRKVKLELNSYNFLVDQVRSHSDNLMIIPSIRPVKEGYMG